tara:strand:+ start:72 stop:2378 length:2307 start_codon:yes stop_codon:yes gene_type:complete
MAGLYLGTDRENNSPIEIPPELLSKHVAILGTIGSGKTVAAKVLLEEATLAGIPSIIIDGEGDIAQMAFKETVSELKKNNVDVSRANLLNDKAEFRIWTPASELGLPLSINPFGSAPSSDDNFDPNASLTIASIDLMASGFSAICGYSEQNKLAQVKGFLNEILMHAVAKKNMPDSFSQLAAMVSNIQAHLEIMGLEADEVTETVELITDSDRKELSRRLRSLNTGVNRLLFQSGVALDPQTLVTPIEQGYTPVNIILTSKLPDEDTKQKFVAELSRSLYKWGSSSPEALKIVYFVDEAHQFLPPNRSPASKAPLMTLFRRGRHCGIACIVASQQLTDIDYKALGNVNTKLIGLVTDSREREKLKGLFTNATNPKECLDSLSIAKPGEFMLICPEKSRTPIPIQVRWLYRKHGRKVTDADIKKIVTSKQRKWAKNVQDGLEHRLSGLRTYQPPEISTSAAQSNEITEEQDLEDDAPSSSSIESQDSVFAGDVNQRTIHGAENVNINFNLNSIDTDEMNAIKDSLQKGFSITELNVSDESIDFRDSVLNQLESRAKSICEEFDKEWIEIERRASSTTGLDSNVKGDTFTWIWYGFGMSIVPFMMGNLNIFSPYQLINTNPRIFVSGFFIALAMGFVLNGIRHRKRFIWGRNNQYYKKHSERYILKKQATVLEAIKNFKISSNYSNLYHQTQLSEYEVIGYIKDFNQVITKRRSHRKFSSRSRELADWIADTKWDQIVSISIDEYVNILSGVDLDFDARTWAKREVMIWD